MSKTKLVLRSAAGLASVAIVFAVWLSWPRFGATQDGYEPLGVLFSGLAFAGLAITVYLQLREMSAEDARMRRTFETLDKQTEAHAHAAFLSFAALRIEYLLATPLADLANEDIPDEAERARVVKSLKIEIMQSMKRLAVLKHSEASVPGLTEP